MNAIPTMYQGVSFRSRLEARWALFFDSLNAPWVYEREGFDLPSGRYLPDFYLPDSQRWVEIKPGPAGALAETLCCELAEATGERVTMCAGDFTARMRLLHWSPAQSAIREALAAFGAEPHQFDGAYLPCVCSACGRLDFTDPGSRGAALCKATGHTFEMRLGPVLDAIRVVRAHHFWDPKEAR
jgi:hypothetical protein